MPVTLSASTHGDLAYENEMLVLVRCRQGRIVAVYEHLDQQTALGFAKMLQDSH